MGRVITKKYNTLEESENALCETLFHNANGYIGIRGAVEEGVPKSWDTMRGSYINGFYDVIPMKQAESLCNLVEEKETMLNVADTMSLEINVDDEPLDLFTGTLCDYERVLDMDAGTTVRIIRWKSPKENIVEIKITRMTSFELLPLFMMKVEIMPIQFEGVITVKSYHKPEVKNYANPKDPRLAAESIQNLRLKEFTMEDNCSIAIAETIKSGLQVCTLVEHYVKDDINTEYRIEDNKGICYMTKEMCVGETFSFVKNTIFLDSRRYKNLKQTALSLKNEIRKHGMEYYCEKQRMYLENFWKTAELGIENQEQLNQSVDFNLYQLLQSVGKDSYSNIAAKGLSGEGYEGHYFWDTEMYIMPFFTITNPEISKILLSYRYAALEKAKENAKLLGHTKGALYPWRTITGVECSGYFPSGTAAYHINGDIAYALIQYYLVTGDVTFMLEKGIELLVETARLWMDVGNFVGDSFHINAVTGPDEYTCMVNDNYYTNCGAKYHLNWVWKLYQEYQTEEIFKNLEFTMEEAREMKRAAENMVFLYDEKLGIHKQDDSFLNKPQWNLSETPKEKFPLLLHYHPLHLYRYQVCKQADAILAYFMYGKELPIDVMKRSYEYYEKITTHDSSLSTCIFSIVASKLGMKEKAYAYFGDSLRLDLENTHHNTKDGIHTANMGGCYMAIVFGFAGLFIRENGISFAPSVPKDWSGYYFKMTYHGSLLDVLIKKTQMEVVWISGGQVEITVGNERKIVSDEKKRVVFRL